MIKCHREYLEKVGDYVITMYFWGFYAESTDISDLDGIEESLKNRLKEIREMKKDLEQWVMRSQPQLVHSSTSIIETLPRGSCIPVKSPTTKYVEHRPAGIFDPDEIQSTAGARREHNSRNTLAWERKGRFRLRETLNAELLDFTRESGF